MARSMLLSGVMRALEGPTGANSPLRDGRSDPVEPRDGRRTAAALHRLVLVADDDVETRRLLALALKLDGYEVVEADHAGSARERLASADGPQGRRPDLIVTDVRMPGPSGLDLVAELRAMGLATPVIVITAFGDEAVHDRGRRLGATDVLDKPFDLGVFRRLVRFRLGKAA